MNKANHDLIDMMVHKCLRRRKSSRQNQNAHDEKQKNLRRKQNDQCKNKKLLTKTTKGLTTNEYSRTQTE